MISYLSKKSWTEVCTLHPAPTILHAERCGFHQSSTLCHTSLVKIFKADNTGEASLEIVRLMNRMVKEKKFTVHPSVLSCLFSLRLNSELGVRASVHKADKSEEQQQKQLSKNRAAQKRAKGKKTDAPHLSKKAAKAMKERNEIQKEMKEAEAEVDKEQRAVTVRTILFCDVYRWSALTMVWLFGIIAHRDAEVAVRLVLSDPQEPDPDAASPRCVTRGIKILSSGEHRLLQGLDASDQGSDHP